MTPRVLSKHRDLIDHGVRAALAGETPLRAMLRYHVGLEDENGLRSDVTGKLLRPSLVLATVEGFDGDVEGALPAAVAVELIHNFSLVHDDIQDRDRMRRGRATLWTIHGVAEAINAGDLMETIAFQTVISAGLDAASCLANATAEMIEGQSLDLAFERRTATVDEYLGMIDRKTGALLRCSLELGGVVAGVDDATRRALVLLGTEIGRAFQIQDDLLGVWGDAEVVGKPSGSDIRRRKKSFPIVLSFSRAEDADRRRLTEIYGQRDVTDADVRWVIAAMNRLGVKEDGAQRVRGYLKRATEALDGLPWSDAARNGMAELIVFLARREK